MPAFLSVTALLLTPFLVLAILDAPAGSTQQVVLIAVYALCAALVPYKHYRDSLYLGKKAAILRWVAITFLFVATVMVHLPNDWVRIAALPFSLTAFIILATSLPSKPSGGALT